MNAERPEIAFVFNSSWYAWNFRISTLRAFVAAGFRVLVIAPPDDAAAQLREEPGVAFAPWRLDLFKRNPLREGASLVQLHRILKTRRPAFVFSFTIKPNIYAGLCAQRLGIAYAPNITGLGMVVGGAGPGAAVAGKLYGLALRGARLAFIQNERDGAVLRNLGVKTPFHRLFGSGVNLDRFSPTPPPSKPPVQFAFIGRLQHDKGVGDFIEAARAMRSISDAARFVVVGGAAHANASGISEETLRQWRSEGVADFVGPQDDVRPFILDSHAVVLPSHGGEGMPKVLLEAAACGRPAVVSDVPGCIDAVEDGVTGYIHRAGDVAGLTAAMTQLQTLPRVEMIALGDAARRRAEEIFSEAHVIDAYLDCARAVITPR